MKQTINEVQEIRHEADNLRLAKDFLKTQTDFLHDKHESLIQIHGNLKKDHETVSQDVIRLNKAFEDAVPWNRRGRFILGVRYSPSICLMFTKSR